MRERVRLSVDSSHPIDEPLGRVLQFVVRIGPDAPPLEAMLVGPGSSERLLVYFPGFNTPLGPWEAAKCRLLAAAFDADVLMVEIPGMSRFGDALPARVRRTMLGGDVQAWALLLAEYQLAALSALGRRLPAVVDVLGYSTGCSMAVAALPGWQGRALVRSVSLIEPVALLSRNLLQLELHNVADVLRQPGTYATNRRHDWVMRTRRRQLREPWVRYGPVDLVAIAQVLAQPHLPGDLPLDGTVAINLVRGERSDLCPRDSFEELHAAAPPVGRTWDVEGFGHPLWHSFPLLDVLIPALGDAARAVA